MSVWAILLCGGSGARMGARENKTLLKIGGMPGIVRCVRAFQGLAEGVALVARAGEEAAFADVLAAYGLRADRIVPGGADRQESALRGLRALPPDADIALIHDGARPFVTKEMIERVIGSVKEFGSAVAAVPARDTAKRADREGRVL